MKTALVTLVSLLSAGFVSAANVASARETTKHYYYWLHPKLGMVKVDRATNAMVTARTARDQSPQSGGRGSPQR